MICIIKDKYFVSLSKHADEKLDVLCCIASVIHFPRDIAVQIKHFVNSRILCSFYCTANVWI